MPVTPHFTFRPTPDVLAAIATIQALLADRARPRVSKTEAIEFALLKAAAELQATSSPRGHDVSAAQLSIVQRSTA